MADHRQGAAGRDLEVDAVEDFPPRVVAEAHLLEAHPRAAGDQRHGAGLVLHVLALVEQAEQALHVGQRLLHLAVHHAEDRQRRGQLQQVGVDQHQVAEGEGAVDHTGGGAPHHGGDAGRDHHGLAEVEQRQRLGRAHPGVFQMAQVLVVALGLVLLVVEVLDRLVVDQRIHRALVGAGVGLHRGAVEARAPLGHRHGPDAVGQQREQGDQGEAPVVGPDQHGGDQQHFQQGRHYGVEGPVEQVGDGAAAALDVARHAAGAAAEVELQAERVQVAEHLQGDLPRGACHDPGEHHLAQLGEQRHADPRGAVGQQQAHRQQHQAGLDVESVDDLLEGDRHVEVDQLGGEDQPQRHADAPGVGAQVGQQRGDHRQVAARLGGAPHAGGGIGVAGGAGRLRADVGFFQGCLPVSRGFVGSIGGRRRAPMVAETAAIFREIHQKPPRLQGCRRLRFSRLKGTRIVCGGVPCVSVSPGRSRSTNTASA
ncbi:hypothetical protein D9M70_314660 [compost metagenome]